MKRALVLIVGCACLFTAGCEDAETGSSTNWDRDKQLRQQVNDLEAKVEKLQDRNRRLQEQVVVLSNLPSDTDANDIDEMYGLKKLEIARRTGLYDKNNDGIKEKLIVYLRPVDSDGDAVKTVGSVRVELWDLNQKPQKALLAKWSIGPLELKKLWLSGVLTHYYHLSLDVGKQIDEKKELTVKVSFTDYITGQVLTAQKTITP